MEKAHENNITDLLEPGQESVNSEQEVEEKTRKKVMSFRLNSVKSGIQILEAE